jgi:hypothetical protein
MGILSSAWMHVTWAWHYGFPSILPLASLAFIVSVIRNKARADQRLLPRRSELLRHGATAYIFGTQIWPDGGATYLAHCLEAAIALAAVAHAVITAKVLTARRALRRLPAE